MDPTANLKIQLELAQRIIARSEEASDEMYDSVPDYACGRPSADELELAEHVVALDEWIRRGGFLPETWQAKREPPEFKNQVLGQWVPFDADKNK